MGSVGEADFIQYHTTATNFSKLSSLPRNHSRSIGSTIQELSTCSPVQIQRSDLSYFAMAYLLGASAVMDSLQCDVRDVQSCISDIMSRIGPVRSLSWKFPDKIAADLDIEDLLDLYSYSDDDEERQVAHIALYELVIDRLVLLLHTLAMFTEATMKAGKAEVPKDHNSGTSVGVIVKKYWGRVSQLHQVVKQIISEKNSASRKVTEMEGDVSRLNAELKQAYNTNRPKTAGLRGLIPPNRAEMATGLSLDPSQLKEFGLISRDEYNKSSQTMETAFSPCDSCSVVQRSFRQSGELVVNICQQQHIPSCLQKFRPQVSHLDWLTGNDLSRWSTEQYKDLQRISKLTATIKPMKDELNECHTKCEHLEKRVNNFDRDMKREKNERSELHKQYELKISDMESHFTKTLELEKVQKDLLKQNKEELENLIEKYKNELEEQKSLLIELENTKTKLEGELSSSKINTAEVTRLESEMSSLQIKLGEVSEKMEESSKQLQKEQARNKSVSKHTENLQSKQQSLLQRIETLDEENKELREQIAEVEEEKDMIEEQFNDTKREMTVIERKLKEKQVEIEHVTADKESLEQTICTLEKSVEALNDKLEEAKERERLIVEYPDLNGPVNPDLKGTGDIMLDMENQVKANNIRIQLLEDQNDGLRNSILKLRNLQETQEPHPQQWATHVKSSKPQPLWNTACVNANDVTETNLTGDYTEMDYRYYQPDIAQKIMKNQSEKITQSPTSKKLPHNQSGLHILEFDSSAVKTHKTSPPKNRPPFGHRPLTGTNQKKSNEEFIVGKTVRPVSAKMNHSGSANKSRPTSGKTFISPMNNSSIGAYIQLKKSGKLSSPVKPTSAVGSRPGTQKTHIPHGGDNDSECSYVKTEQYSCQNCDKMYSRERDLDIHMSYCTG